MHALHVNSGGGFNIWWEVGARLALRERGITTAGELGISAGTLVAAMCATDQLDVLDAMSGGTPLIGVPPYLLKDDVWKRNRWWSWVRKDGVFSPRPLYRLLRRFLTDATFHVPFGAGVVRIDRHATFSVIREYEPRDVVIDACVASTCIPGLVQSWPVGDIRCLDGGVRNASPIGSLMALDLVCDRVVMVTTRHDEEPVNRPTKIPALRNALFAISALMDEEIRTDIARFKDTQDFLRKLGLDRTVRWDGKEVRRYAYMDVRPSTSLGSGTNTSTADVDRLKAQGYDDAMNATWVNT